jgi:hypothetical protein
MVVGYQEVGSQTSLQRVDSLALLVVFFMKGEKSTCSNVFLPPSLCQDQQDLLFYSISSEMIPPVGQD